jgi:hypothetical protein
MLMLAGFNLGMCPPPVDDTKAEESREAVVLTERF